MKGLNLNSSKGFSIESHKNYFNFKLIIIWLFCTAAAFATTGFLFLGLKTGDSKNFIYGGIAIALFLLLFVIENIFISNREIAVFVMLAHSLAFGILLFFYSVAFAFILIGVVFWALFYGNFRGNKIINNSIKFSFFEFNRWVLPKGILAVALVVGTIIPISLRASTEQVFPIPSSVFEGVLKESQKVVGIFFPGVNILQPLGEFSIQMAEENVNNLPEVKFLSNAMKQQLIEKTAQSFQDQIIGILGTEASPKLSISEILYQSAKDKFLALSNTAQKWFYVIIGALTFFILTGIFLPLRWAISLLAYFIYELLLALGFIRISIENSPREVIVIE